MNTDRGRHGTTELAEPSSREGITITITVKKVVIGIVIALLLLVCLGCGKDSPYKGTMSCSDGWGMSATGQVSYTKGNSVGIITSSGVVEFPADRCKKV